MIDFTIFSPRVRQLAGLDISSSSVKLVELAGSGKDGFRVERYAIETLPRDAVVDGNIASLDAVGDSIRRAVRRMGAGLKNVAVALPAAAVITKRIILPADLREDEMEVHVESEASQYIPFPLDEVNLDFQVLGPHGENDDEVEVLIAASRKEKVEDRVAAVEAAGLKVAVMDVDSFAAHAAFDRIGQRLPEQGRNKIIALINIGASITSVAVLRNGQQIYGREQAFGGNQLTQEVARQYSMSLEEAEVAKRTGNLPDDYAHDLLRPFLDNLALEISRAMQFFFTSTPYNHVDYIVLAGGCALLPGLAEIVSGRTQIPASLANPFEDMTLSPSVRSRNLAADAPAMLVACGLAMRRFDA